MSPAVRKVVWSARLPGREGGEHLAVVEDGRISLEGSLELPSWPPVRRRLFAEVPAVVVVGHTVSFGTTAAP